MTSEARACILCLSDKIDNTKSLAVINPALALEWHPTKNFPLSPEDVSATSNHKVYWQCNKGHEWDARIYNRNNGVGCPYCAGKKAIPGETDLASQYPQLASEWDYEKNFPLTPEEITGGSSRKFYWKCPLGHSYQADPAHRTRDNTGCPICANKVVVAGFNDLATTHPEIAALWHPTKNGKLTPQDVYAGTTKRAWFMCPNGHELHKEIRVFVKYQGQCKTCNEWRAIPGKTDFESLYPELAKMWHPTKNVDKLPSQYSAKSEQHVMWLCAEGHEFDAAIATVIRHGGCVECEKQQVQKMRAFDKECFLNKRICKDATATTEPLRKLLCTQFIKRITDQHKHAKPAPIPKSKQHDKVQKTISSDVAQQLKSSPNSLCVGINDLQTTHPDVAAMWHPTANGVKQPYQYRPESERCMTWLCSKGHMFTSKIRTVVKHGRCLVCEKEERGTFASVHPDLALEWHPTKNGDLTPADFSPCSGQVVWWQGPCGHEWKTSICNRVAGKGCSTCSKKTSFPEQALYYYIHQLDETAINTDRHLRIELDVYIPPLRRAVEYDGEAWHQDLDKDLRKNEICARNNISVIRIRETGCPHMDENPNVQILHVPPNPPDDILQQIIQEVCEILFPGCVIDINLERDRDIIDAMTQRLTFERSIAGKSPWLMKMWHNEKNTKHSPELLHPKSNKMVYWRCHNGHEFQRTVSDMTTRGGCCPHCTLQERKYVVVQTGECFLLLQDAAKALNIDSDLILYSAIFRRTIGPQQLLILWHHDYIRHSVNHDESALIPKEFSVHYDTRIINVDTGERFPDAHAAAHSIGHRSTCGIVQCCTHKRETCAGYHWMYYYDYVQTLPWNQPQK